MPMLQKLTLKIIKTRIIKSFLKMKEYVGISKLIKHRIKIGMVRSTYIYIHQQKTKPTTSTQQTYITMASLCFAI